MAQWYASSGGMGEPDDLKKVKQRCSRERKAAAALQILQTMQPSPLKPQQVAVLISGSLLMCSWRFVSERLQAFEQQGLHSLAEVWIVVAASIGVGQLARMVARSHPVEELVKGYTAGPALTEPSSSSLPYLPEKEGRETGKVVEPEEDQDDVCVQKRMAQAEAAAKLAKYQTGLRQLLSSINKTGKIADDAQLLYKLADQLFSSPVNLCELFNQGGVPVMMAAARSALKALTGPTPRQDVLPALMQVSWVLLQVAHGPPGCWAALAAEDNVVRTLLELTAAVMAVPAAAEAKESILRNWSWILLVLCDGGARSRGSMQQMQSAAGSSVAALACVSAMMDAGAVELLQQLMTLQFGVGPGWVATATLGLFLQQGQQQQQQHQKTTPQADTKQHHQQQRPGQLAQHLTQAAAQALLQPDSLHGLGYMLNHQPRLSDRLKGLVVGLVHYLLSFHTTQLLQLLLEERLVGSFAAGAPPKLGRLLVCQLLSVRGQEVMSKIEASFELDVPHALAQIIPLPVHLKLPPAPMQQQLQQQQAQQQQQQHQQQGDAEIQPEGEIQASAPQQSQHPQQQQQQPGLADDVYTDILACRLLLQHNRLDELLDAFTEELLSAEDADGPSQSSAAAAAVEGAGQQRPAQEAPSSPVCDAVLRLVRHLMSRDLELQAVQHMRGDSVDDSLSSLSSSSSSVIDIALAIPDESGVYSTVMSGLISDDQLPAAAGQSSSSSSSGLLVLPPLPASAEPAPCSCSSSSKQCRKVVFQFGELHHAVDRRMYKRIRQSSKLVGSILGREKVVPGQPVTLFTTPHFTHEANCWVLQWLERWLATGELKGFSTLQAAKLWVAADFLQVDGLQVACEDLIVAAAKQDAAQLEVALELCARHRTSSSRLQRLTVQILLRGLGSEGGVARLRRLLQQHKVVLLPSLHAEVRDRLVTLCMLNAGLDDDTPGDGVE